MATADIRILRPSTFGSAGTHKFQVAAASGFPTINEGEPVGYALGQQYAATLATDEPVVGTTFMAGISASASTETASVDGTVQVTPLVPGVVYMAAANSAVTVTTQADYNALVGKRVLFDKTSDVYTVLGTDGATYGLVIEDLDVTQYPGKIAFSIRTGASYLA